MMQSVRRWFAPQDMTVGTPWKKILAFMVPMLIGNLAQQVYGATDSAVVGKFVGDNALAAVGSTMPTINFMLALFIGVAIGSGILVSQYFGAKDRARLSLVIGNCLTLTAIASAVVMLGGYVLTDWLLAALNTPLEFRAWTADYLHIFFLGSAGFMFYNVLSGILRGLGDSLSALVYLIVCTILNIGLDIWFVVSFHWGVAGVALATILAQAISAWLCFARLRKMREVFDISRHTLRLDKPMVGRILKLGVPSGLTQAIFSVAMLLVQQLQNQYGKAELSPLYGVQYIAASIVVMRVDAFTMMPTFSFGQAMTTYIGQNVGARRMDRILLGTRQGTLLAAGTSLALTGAILLFGRSLMHLFTDTQQVIDISMRMMKILALGYVAMSVLQALSGVMRGAGDTLTPMWISAFTSIALRVPIAYLTAWATRTPDMPRGIPESIYISMLVTWTAGAIINYLAYRSGRWRRKLPADMQPPHLQQQTKEG